MAHSNLYTPPRMLVFFVMISLLIHSGQLKSVVTTLHVFITSHAVVCHCRYQEMDFGRFLKVGFVFQKGGTCICSVLQVSLVLLVAMATVMSMTTPAFGRSLSARCGGASEPDFNRLVFNDKLHSSFYQLPPLQALLENSSSVRLPTTMFPSER